MGPINILPCWLGRMSSSFRRAMKCPCKMMVARHPFWFLSSVTISMIVIIIQTRSPVTVQMSASHTPRTPSLYWQAAALAHLTPSSDSEPCLQTNCSPCPLAASVFLWWPCALKRSEFQPMQWGGTLPVLSLFIVYSFAAYRYLPLLEVSDTSRTLRILFYPY